MKSVLRFVLLVPILYCLACGGGKKGDQPTDAHNTPPPGTLMCRAEMPVTDKLNKFIFSVAVKSDSNTVNGTYSIQAAFGPDTANGAFTMPKGLERYTLTIRKGILPATYVVGFTIPKDTTFYDYFEVTGKHLAIGMKYLKAYTFE